MTLDGAMLGEKKSDGRYCVNLSSIAGNKHWTAMSYYLLKSIQIYFKLLFNILKIENIFIIFKSK